MTAFPYIELKIQEIQTFRVVRLTNSAVPEQKKTGHMGLGLENVRHTVEKYAGTINLGAISGKLSYQYPVPGKGASMIYGCMDLLLCAGIPLAGARLFYDPQKRNVCYLCCRSRVLPSLSAHTADAPFKPADGMER